MKGLYLISFVLLSLLLAYQNFKIFLILSSVSVVFMIYIIIRLRYEFSYFPLYLITKAQGRNFKLAKNLAEIKNTLKHSDKGLVIEELFATPAWKPILSIESTNGPLWEILRKNFLILIKYLPSKSKLFMISEEEANYLIKAGKEISSSQVSISTVRVFLRWMFCENHLDLTPLEEEDKSTVPPNQSHFQFIDQEINENILQRLYESSVEYRKEIALKGVGLWERKLDSVQIVKSIIKKSKFANLFDWEKPEFYSAVMQPFVISPMINMSDIAVSIQKMYPNYSKDKFPEFLNYVDQCIADSHPFPILERYDKETNTQIFIDLTTLKDYKQQFNTTILNFGLGIRSCLGRILAKEFFKGFFEPIFQCSKFQPLNGHLYSGRDNDNSSVSESIYTLKVFSKVLIKELFTSRK